MSNSRGTFNGKNIFVTGAATDIGRATALAFARAGGTVVIGDVDDRAAETVTAITDAGSRSGSHFDDRAMAGRSGIR